MPLFVALARALPDRRAFDVTDFELRERAGENFAGKECRCLRFVDLRISLFDLDPISSLDQAETRAAQLLRSPRRLIGSCSTGPPSKSLLNSDSGGRWSTWTTDD
ncbi:hypothetical protein [Bradyrhizobium sp. BR 1433]|uniref:hypothetical protein n=1 Tax=Bradyrhizobium sp. BR 1433 TaxID=3447967 RepID=UPI003EE70E6C